MKHLKTILLAALTLLSVLPAIAQNSSEEPIITIKTNRYNLYGDENNFQMSMTAMQNVGHTTVEVDFGYGRQPFVISADGALSEDQDNEVVTGGTVISGNVSPEGVIRVYGNPAHIDYIDCHGSNIYDLDVSRLSNLAILECGHNELQTLYTDGLHYLEYLDVKDNEFSDGLYLSHHPYLKYLNVNQLGDHALDHCNGSLIISQYPALNIFTAWDSHCLKTLDSKGCENLVQMSIDNSGVRDLDLSGNPYLMILNIADCGISNIDLSHNTYLVELYADNQGTEDDSRKMRSLDLSNNTYLQRLSCAGNNLQELDITNQWNLVSLSASHNHISSVKGLDYEEHLRLKELGQPAGPDSLAYADLRFNNLTFATLPMVDPLTEFEYTDQFEVPVSAEYGVCEAGRLDISRYVLREGTATAVALAGISRDGFSYDYQLVDGEDFDYDPETGIVTFLKAQADSVQVACFNNVLNGTVILTTKFLVRSAEDYGKPVELAAFTIDGNREATISVATREDETIYADFGDGHQVPFDVPAATLTDITGNAAGSIRLFGRVGASVNTLTTDNVPVTMADVNRLTTLSSLSITNGQLDSIDLGWNHLLRELNLSGNKLTSLDLNGENSAYNKNQLLSVNVSRNLLEFFDPGLSSVTILTMDCSDNLLPEINLNTMSRVENLNLSHNKLTEVRLDDCEGVKTLNLSGNELTTIDITPCTSLTALDLTDNHFTFATLPNAAPGFVFAPQQKIKVASRAQSVNLSAVAEIRGIKTHYTWKNAATGAVLTEGSDYTISEGRTTFAENVQGQTLYCEMQNNLYPQFSEENVLRTTNVIATGMPQHCIASFTTPVGDQRALLSLASTEPDTYIYIDWGDGDLREYGLQTMFTRFRDDLTIENANVKVYSNVAPHGNMYVFSMDSVTVANLDVAPMTELYCLTLDNAGLHDVDISHNLKLGEINFEGNHLTSLDLTGHPHLNMVTLSHNDLSEIKLAQGNHIGWFAAAYNLLDDFDWGTLSDAYNIDLAGNNISAIDMSKLTGLGQLWISQNNLREIDLEGHNLYVLDISANRFDLTTLPYPSIPVFFYGNQQPIDVECVNGKIDLSAQASAWEVPSEMYFFDGPIDITVDDEGNAELNTSEFTPGVDFFNNDGFISFVQDHPSVTGLIINELYPSLLLYTKTIRVTADPTLGIDDLTTSQPHDLTTSYTYNLQGQRINASTRGLIIKGGRVYLNR